MDAFRYAGIDVPRDRQEALMEMLSTLSIDGGENPELRAYLEQDLDRFLYTLELVPDGQGQALEIGANPYFTTALLHDFRRGYAFDRLNYFEGSGDRVLQHVEWQGLDGERRSLPIDSFNVNIEASEIPIEPERYDLVLFCEVLEHFTHNPLRAVREIWRILKPGGILVLTTPNVARFENVIAFLEGRNIYDPYSGYGAHGRHNREYTRHELHMLMRHAGFVCDTDFTSDVHVQGGSTVSKEQTLALLDTIPHRTNDLGQYLFSRWRKEGPGSDKFPSWLYRSYSAAHMAG